MRIRQAVLDDAETIARYNCALARETENKELDWNLIYPGVQALIQHPERGKYLVAESDGRVVGQLMHTREWSDWRNGDIWWLQSVYVAPEHRRQGVFRALFTALRTAALKATDPHVVGLRLYVEQDNHTARQTYGSLGLHPPGYLVLESMFSSLREVSG